MIAPGLRTHFAPDDMQNIHRYWSRSLLELASANLLVATEYFRPLGGLFYLPLHRMFGFNPVPYRIVSFAILCTGAWLLYLLARRITGSRFGGAVAVIAGGFHANAAAAYISTAVVYEILCHAFTAGAVLYYVRVRQGKAFLSLRQTAILVALTACALNAKEMGVAVAPALVLYEALFRDHRLLGRPRAREIWPLVAVLCLTALYAGGKAAGGESYTGNPAYTPVWTADRYLETTRAYAGYLLFFDGPAETWEALLFWAALMVCAALLRRRDMLWGALFAAVAFLPVNFITVREGFVLHVPLIGLGIWAGGLAAAVTDVAARLSKTGAETMDQVRAIIFAALLVGAIAVHYPRFRHIEVGLLNAQRENWEVLSEFRRLDLKFRPGERVLFRDTPFEDNWDVYFIAKLWSRDPSVRVSLTTEVSKAIRGDLPGASEFDREFRFEGTRLVLVKSGESR